MKAGNKELQAAFPANQIKDVIKCKQEHYQKNIKQDTQVMIIALKVSKIITFSETLGPRNDK